MEGYRKIGGGHLAGYPENCDEESGDLDNHIRGLVHSPIIEEMQKHGTTEFYVVVYKRKKGGKIQ